MQGEPTGTRYRVQRLAGRGRCRGTDSTPEQQQQESALRQFGATLASARWSTPSVICRGRRWRGGHMQGRSGQACVSKHMEVCQGSTSACQLVLAEEEAKKAASNESTAQQKNTSVNYAVRKPVCSRQRYHPGVQHCGTHRSIVHVLQGRLDSQGGPAH